MEDDAHLFEGVPLNDLGIGESAQVMRVNADMVTTKFLSNEGIKPGVLVRIVAIGSSNDILLETNNQRIHITEEMASAVILGRVNA